MRLFDLLKVWEPTFDARNTKVHLARYNGDERPLDVFLEGQFDEWQRWQSKRNFQRKFVVSLVNTGSPTRWLYAGLFRSIDYVEEGEPKPHYYYSLERVAACEEWVGRLYLESFYTKRHSYPRGETLAEDLTVSELLAERLSIADFPGFKAVNLTKAQLDIVVRTQTAAWRAALASVKGIYVITDTDTGRLYVGKASGADGIWGRWSAYASNGHGGNIALRKEFGIEATEERRQALRFAVLEIADLSATEDDICERERHWKFVLLSREHGYNRN
ncbi:GIY-YIG nuclease family protein [Xanthomonas campestris pv. raphani]|uniref:GIY-YIG nuclease family protein n=1 Tax=Xanthomonas campestris TaxID=339 RepID=UPI002B22CDD7|nr:GIY-YIG nuclease family protein [Xanthomonas campestris]MEA9911553.1 GIY-YIG nuclease family protein [Xanthomonas campestris pv. raphani]